LRTNASCICNIGNTTWVPQPASEDQPADARKVYTRLMENYAAYMAYTDHVVGRDSITPVDPACKDKGRFEFTGKFEKVVFELNK
jgi:hypothetical protein